MVFTIGHSSRTIEDFIGLLWSNEVAEVIDVRTIPRSRRDPQFNLETLPGSLAAAGIGYSHMSGLGGLRHARADSPNIGWHNASFRGYADYMQSPEFAANVDAVVALARSRQCALMCAEAVPWRCHRSLIADALLVRGGTLGGHPWAPRAQAACAHLVRPSRGPACHVSCSRVNSGSGETMNAAAPPRRLEAITPSQDLDSVLAAARGCRACEARLPLGPRPVLQAGYTSRLLVVGQAPGVRVHKSGIPWDDPSGERLRNWTGLCENRFYDARHVAIIPMGFCYPGRGQGGDLPPRRECADLWLDGLLARLPHVELTLLIGLYAQRHFLGRRRKASLTETVKAWREFAPDFIPLPHPSARNTPWFQRNPWFEQELLPALRQRVGLLKLDGVTA